MTILSFLLQVGYQNKTVVDANWTKNLIEKKNTDLRNPLEQTGKCGGSIAGYYAVQLRRLTI